MVFQVMNIAIVEGNKNLGGLNPLHCDGIENVSELQKRGVSCDQCARILKCFDMINMHAALNMHMTCFGRRNRSNRWRSNSIDDDDVGYPMGVAGLDEW